LSKNIYLPIENNNKILNLSKCLKNTWFKSNIVESIQKNTVPIEINKTRKYVKLENKTIQINMVLNKSQKECLAHLVDIYRYFYNRAISYINNYDKNTNNTFYKINPKDEKTKIILNVKNEKNKFSMFTMRKYLKNNKPSWIKLIPPSHLIDKALNEASNNYKKCIEKFQKTRKTFNLKYKKYSKLQTINIEKTFINLKNNNFSLFYNLKYKSKYDKNKNYCLRNIKLSEKINKYKICDSSISYNKYLQKFTLNLIYSNTDINISENKKQEILKNKKVFSLDTGVRTVETCYSDNKVVELGINTMDTVYKYCKEIDILNSIISKKKYVKKYKNGGTKELNVNSKRKKKLQRALHKKYEKLKNIKNELHNKIINYLIYNSGKIIKPPFKTQEMASKLHSKTARQMNTISYYKLKEKLENKCKEFDIDFLIKDEHYTSKTCTKCGNIKCNLGSNKKYICNKCNLIIDRDINGARNIMLKNNSF
jgi:transposase